MDDILVRLRDQLKPQGELRPLCLEAAAEIERLRAALEFCALDSHIIYDVDNKPQIERTFVAKRAQAALAATSQQRADNS